MKNSQVRTSFVRSLTCIVLTWLSIAEHVRYVYNLQDGDSTTDESEDSDAWESDESTLSWRLSNRVNGRRSSQSPLPSSISNKKRMSLLTGQYFDIPEEPEYAHYTCGVDTSRPTKRRFFLPDEGGGVDSSVDMQTRMFNGYGRHDLAGLMARGGRSADEAEEEDYDEGMVVDS